MSRQTLDRLLEGAEGVKLNLSDGQVLNVTRAELESPELFRQVLREAGCDPPEYTEAEFEDVVTALFMLADQCVPVPAV